MPVNLKTKPTRKPGFLSPRAHCVSSVKVHKVFQWFCCFVFETFWMLIRPCFRKNVCPANHIGFFVQSGAANVVPPKICVNNNLALGTVMNNAGSGINIVVVNGECLGLNLGVEPLIEFLKGVETGSVVLMAVYDEGSTKLNEEARTLISDLGSSTIHSLGYRDNWVFVGGKGTTGKSNFEKHMKSDDSKNKYDNWPEMVEVEGCVPKYVE
uniref:ILEI/PANDER domain-containing protein n=1 Tax=Poecilia latipinna TaxID=48699 RepID=A0A3B3TUE6_9TELE